MYVPKRTEDNLQRIKHFYRQSQTYGQEDYEEVKQDEDEEEMGFLGMHENVTRMENATTKYSEKATALIKQLVTAQSPNVIDRDKLKEVARIQRVRFFGLLSLPFSVAFFMFFAVSTFLHEDVTNVYLVENGLRRDLGGDIDDIKNVAEVWDWLRNNLASKVFNQVDEFGDPIADKRMWSRVLMYNQLQGSLVLEQMRSTRELCQNGEGIFGDMVCYPYDTITEKAFTGRPDYTPLQDANPTWYTGGNSTIQARKEFYDRAFAVSTTNARRLRTMRAEYMSKLPGGRPDGNAFNAYLYQNTPYSVIQEQLQYLYERAWIDAQTSQLTVKALFMNAEVGRPRLEQFEVLFRFSRGGGVFVKQSLDSIFLEMWDGGVSLGFDVLATIMLLIVSLMLAQRLQRAHKKGEIWKTCRKAFIILDGLILFFGWVIILCYLFQSTLLTNVVDVLKQVIQSQIDDIPPHAQKLGQELMAEADSIKYFNSWFHILQSEYHILLMFRFFSAFHAQPRLGVVTSTLEASIIDIIHFLIVLLPTFLAYAISAVFIFGRRLEEYATFDAAIGLCFQMMMEGEYDWETLSEEHYWTAALWTWTFMLLLVLLMCNMVLAIVMDIYTDIRKNAGDSETVCTTFWHLAQRVNPCGRWVSNKEILEKVDKMEQLVTREDILETFPNMSETQLNGLLVACRYQIEAESMKDIDVMDAMKMTMAIKMSMDKVNEDVAQLQDGSFEGLDKEALDKADASDSWLQQLASQMAVHNHWMLAIQWQLQQLQWQWSAMESIYGPDAIYTAPSYAPSSDLKVPVDAQEDVVL